MKKIYYCLLLFVGFTGISFSQTTTLDPNLQKEMEDRLLQTYRPYFRIDIDTKEPINNAESAKVNCKKIAKYVYLSLVNDGVSQPNANYFANFVLDACNSVFNTP